MDEKIYKYPYNLRILNIGGLPFACLFSCIFCSSLTKLISYFSKVGVDATNFLTRLGQADAESVLMVLFLGPFIFWWFYLSYRYPVYKIKDTGITIQYTFRKIFVNWDEIISIKSQWSLLGKNWKVITKKKFWIFYLDGLLVGSIFTPCILLHRGLIEIDELVDTINLHINYKELEQ